MAELSHEESMVIYYSGTGGIGKTALLAELQKYLNTKNQIAEKTNRALEIFEKIYNTLKPLNNPRSIDAAEKYAYAEF